MNRFSEEMTSIALGGQPLDNAGTVLCSRVLRKEMNRPADVDD